MIGLASLLWLDFGAFQLFRILTKASQLPSPKNSWPLLVLEDKLSGARIFVLRGNVVGRPWGCGSHRTRWDSSSVFLWGLVLNSVFSTSGSSQPLEARPLYLLLVLEHLSYGSSWASPRQHPDLSSEVISLEVPSGAAQHSCSHTLAHYSFLISFLDSYHSLEGCWPISHGLFTVSDRAVGAGGRGCILSIPTAASTFPGTLVPRCLLAGVAHLPQPRCCILLYLSIA